jgi:hypothetical protein
MAQILLSIQGECLIELDLLSNLNKIALRIFYFSTFSAVTSPYPATVQKLSPYADLCSAPKSAMHDGTTNLLNTILSTVLISAMSL